MDINKLKENAFIIIPASAALLSIIYLSKRERSDEKKGIIEVPFPRNAINWPIFGK
jgi:putative exporter of polyketide antibiotics